MTYTQLCQNLADSERALRKGQKVNTAIKGGRYDQLADMENHFPEQYPAYCKSLDERLQKPYDFKTILASIPSA